MSDLRPPPPTRRRRSAYPLVWILLIAALVAVVFYARDATGGTRVLFVGNSYTTYNDLPSMVDELAGSAGVGVSTSVIAPGGAWLADHVRAGDVEAALTEGAYDVVVFQEQSMAPADPGVARRSTYPAAARLAEVAAGAGTRVVFFQTWGHAAGNSAVGHGTYESMQNAISATYSDLAVRYAGDLAPAGEAWRTHLLSGVDLPLHDADGSHPSPAGSYLAAAVIASTITGVDPGEFAWSGPLPPDHASLLLESARQALGG